MKFSLLNKVEEPQNEFAGNYIEDLLINRLVGIISPSADVVDYVSGILSRPLIYKENISYRSELIKEFIENPGLIDELYKALTEYDNLKEIKLKSKHRSVFILKSINDNKEKNMAACSEMQINANFGRMVLSSLKSIYNILKLHSVKSAALTDMRQICHGIIDNPSVSELHNIFNEIATVDIEETTFQLIAGFDENLHISDVYINRIKYLLPKIQDELEPHKISFFKKQKIEYTDDRIIVPMNFKTEEISDYLIREGVRELSFVIDIITESIYQKLYEISKELVFYRFALRYFDFLKENNLKYCNPEILEETENTLEYSLLSDLFLICSEISSYGICNVIPNDVSLTPDIKGALIKGKNNSGKTVFLRSIGIAQVFAQSGLPVTAAFAKISIRNGIFTQFSSAEEKFTIGDISGRFEAEVKEIDTIIKNIKSNSLILFNETFQTTSFDEAAEGMKDILEFITELKGKWLFVTHILKLFNMYEDDSSNVIFMQTSEEENKKHKMEIIKTI